MEIFASDHFEYTLECPSCDISIELKVLNEDEFPVYCPMCGDDINEDWVLVE